MPAARPGRDTPPPIAVVTGSAELDPASRLFTDTRCRRSCSPWPGAPRRPASELAAAGGDVVVLDRLTPDSLLGELARRGLHRVLCEGGPALFGELIAADAVDELCLTVAPLLAGARPAGSPRAGRGRHRARWSWPASCRRTACCCCATAAIGPIG